MIGPAPKYVIQLTTEEREIAASGSRQDYSCR